MVVAQFPSRIQRKWAFRELLSELLNLVDGVFMEQRKCAHRGIISRLNVCIARGVRVWSMSDSNVCKANAYC